MVERFQPPVIRLEELPEIDWILISHDHYDHLDMETVEFFKDKEPVCGSSGSWRPSPLLGDSGDQILKWTGGRKSVDGIDFYCTPSQHFSGRIGQDMKTLGLLVVGSRECQNILQWGFGYDIHYRQIGKRLRPFDLVFMDSGNTA